MKAQEHKITLQVFGIILLLHFLYILLGVALDATRKDLKVQLVTGAVGQSLYQNCLEPNKGIFEKEFEETQSKTNQQNLAKIQNKIRIFNVSEIVIQLLLTYLFSGFIVRFILKKTKN